MQLFGEHRPPFEISREGLALRIERKGEHCAYFRECLGEKVEKTLLADGDKILIHPVEPVSKPRELTPLLLIKFKTKLEAAPKRKADIYVTFPVEAGVFSEDDKEGAGLDVFTLARQKMTLYGDPSAGKLCRYWESDIFSEPPDVDPLVEGVMKLKIVNSTSQWIELGKAVFNAFGMKIYYDEKMTGMAATLKLESRALAETEFAESPPFPGMKKAIERYRHKLLSVSSKSFLMEEGL